MFFRKFLVVVLPLLACAAIAFLYPILANIIPVLFWLHLLFGGILGVVLALLIPLMGGRRREPFATLFWVPTAILVIVLALQAMIASGWLTAPVLAFLYKGNTFTILVEGAFTGFLATLAIRGK